MLDDLCQLWWWWIFLFRTFCLEW